MHSAPNVHAKISKIGYTCASIIYSCLLALFRSDIEGAISGHNVPFQQLMEAVIYSYFIHQKVLLFAQQIYL